MQPRHLRCRGRIRTFMPRSSLGQEPLGCERAGSAAGAARLPGAFGFDARRIVDAQRAHLGPADEDDRCDDETAPGPEARVDSAGPSRLVGGDAAVAGDNVHDPDDRQQQVDEVAVVEAGCGLRLLVRFVHCSHELLQPKVTLRMMTSTSATPAIGTGRFQTGGFGSPRSSKSAFGVSEQTSPRSAWAGAGAAREVTMPERAMPAAKAVLGPRHAARGPARAGRRGPARTEA